MQADMEQLTSKADSKKPPSRAAELDELATRHKLQITHLEQVQRLLHNDEVSWLGELAELMGDVVLLGRAAKHRGALYCNRGIKGWQRQFPV